MLRYIEPEAEAELEESADQYDVAVPGLGLDFILEMRERTERVFEGPSEYPVFGDAKDVRCAHAVGRFPHLIVYLVTADTVHGLPSCIHGGSRGIG
jgi:hypothetical protein